LRLLLVGFQDQDNLGIRYLTAAVRHHGHVCDVVTYADDPAPLCARVAREEPDLVGFSLIFQYMAPAFARVIAALRGSGYAGHVTIGGHYPSFDPAQVLDRMPGLDSVVRFEGEVTLVELLARLEACHDWRDLEGLACRGIDGAVRVNPHRDSLDDLDALPPPAREDVDYERQPRPTASMLGSRGCPWNCSFCSIRPFYEAQGGALRRLRAPAAVVEEMRALHHERGVAIFLFQDDDFLAIGQRGREWALAVARAVAGSDLRGRIGLKISCRSDEVREDVLRELRDAGGLTHVYLGVESGDADGLRHLNKQLDPETHLRAGEILRRLDLSFDFGFMLLEPYSRIAEVRRNVEFLARFVGDGWSVATFCRTLPYAGTPLKDRLEREGRLLGTPFDPDYRFLDPRLDHFYDWMLRTFRRRNFTNEGLSHYLRALQFELHLRVGRPPATESERAYGRQLTSICNRIACYTLEAALDHVASRSLAELERDPSYLEGLTAHEAREERRLEAEVRAFYARLQRHARPALAGGFARSWTLAEHEASP
jgi:radical SAM superfamily enzyme YgiQ (UPF0313 family)